MTERAARLAKLSAMLEPLVDAAEKYCEAHPDEFDDLDVDLSLLPTELSELIYALNPEDVRLLLDAWRETPPHDMVLHCPNCGKQHLDIGEFATRVHRKHLCENTPDGPSTGCGHLWVPFSYATRGVRALPLKPLDVVDERTYEQKEADGDLTPKDVLVEHGEIIEDALCLFGESGLEFRPETKQRAFRAAKAVVAVLGKRPGPWTPPDDG